jgi:hypothetical protein
LRLAPPILKRTPRHFWWAVLKMGWSFPLFTLFVFRLSTLRAKEEV